MFKLSSPKSIKKSPKIGRGKARRGGHTVGRGMKGQKSRTGYKSPRQGFEGGSMPLSRRIPKLRGFTRGFLKAKVNVVNINLSDLETLFESGDVISFDTLIEKGIVSAKSKNTNVKILGDGEVSKKFELSGVKVSKSALIKIEAAGGKVE